MLIVPLGTFIPKLDQAICKSASDFRGTLAPFEVPWIHFYSYGFSNPDHSGQRPPWQVHLCRDLAVFSAGRQAKKRLRAVDLVSMEGEKRLPSNGIRVIICRIGLLLSSPISWGNMARHNAV